MTFLRHLALYLLAAVSLGVHAQVVATISTPSAIGTVDKAFNASTNRFYLVAAYSNALTVVDANTNSATTVNVADGPRFVAVNATTNRIYTSNVDDFSLSVIDGATHAVTNLAIGGAGPIAINERTNQVFVMRRGVNGEVTVVDGATNTWHTIKTGSSRPLSMVVNPDTNRLYVLHYEYGTASGDLRVIDVSSNSDTPPNVAITLPGTPSLLALNRVTNKVYMAGGERSAAIVEIDGATNAVTPIPTPGYSNNGPSDLVIDAVANRVYMASSMEVLVVEGATRAENSIPTGSVTRLAVDAAAGRVYGIGDAGGGEQHRLIVIDGASRNFSYVNLPRQSTAVAVNPANHRIYAFSDVTTVLDGNAIPTPGANYGVNVQGMWWNWPAGSESGWGLDIAQQGNVIFATWFTYDDDGSAMWLVIPNMARESDTFYRGDVYRTTGPAWSSATFNPAGVASTVVGKMSLTVTDANNAEFSGVVNGRGIRKRITRLVYAATVPTCTAGGPPGAQPNYQDIWWSAPAGGESGWGLYLTHQADILFAVWYTYDEGGKGMWLVASRVERAGSGNYQGTLYRTWGPPYSTDYYLTSTRTTTMPVGSVNLSFADANNGLFTYTYMGVTRSKNITRQVFSAPPTVCR